MGTTVSKGVNSSVENKKAPTVLLASSDTANYYIIQKTNITSQDEETGESTQWSPTVLLGSDDMGAGSYIKRLGIQAPPGSTVTFNGDDGKFFENFTHNMMIGKVGIFELNIDFDDIGYSRIEQVQVDLPSSIMGDIIIDAIYVKVGI